MADVHFNEADHSYTIGAWRAPVTVTGLINEYLNQYAGVDRQVMERAAAFGKALHDLNKLMLRGTLDADALDPQLVPYMNGLAKFHDSYEITIDQCDVEKPLGSKRLGIAGTPDIVIHDGAIFDIKSRAFMKLADPLQLAAYDKLSGGNGNSRPHYSVYITPDNFKVTKCNDKNAWPLFSRMLKHWHDTQKLNNYLSGWRTR
ncbi:MAG: hypothetical protein FJ119_10815 [Deltaproteobacteria bacterium]|nr:hypothetical protein [Deltaproteobacteria bacterium]